MGPFLITISKNLRRMLHIINRHATLKRNYRLDFFTAPDYGHEKSINGKQSDELR